MKHVNYYLIALLATPLLGCSSTPATGPTNPAAWSQIQPGMTKEEVHATLGQPLRETQQEAKWKSPEVKSGWPRKTYWRELQVLFDENGRVKGTRDYEQQK